MSGKPVVGKEGRFGDYVTDGETNAGLTRGDRMESMTNERAYELLQLRREYIEANGGPKKKKAGARKAPAKKASAKKSPAKKAAVKKTPAKKAAATKSVDSDSSDEQ